MADEEEEEEEEVVVVVVEVVVDTEVSLLLMPLQLINTCLTPSTTSFTIALQPPAVSSSARHTGRCETNNCDPNVITNFGFKWCGVMTWRSAAAAK